MHGGEEYFHGAFGNPLEKLGQISKQCKVCCAWTSASAKHKEQHIQSNDKIELSISQSLRVSWFGWTPFFGFISPKFVCMWHHWHCWAIPLSVRIAKWWWNMFNYPFVFFDFRRSHAKTQFHSFYGQHWPLRIQFLIEVFHVIHWLEK